MRHISFSKLCSNCFRFGINPSSEPMLIHWKMDAWEPISVKFNQNTIIVIHVNLKLSYVEYRPFVSLPQYVNSWRPRQNDRHFADDIFKCIIWHGNTWILIKVSLKFVPKGPINNIPAFVQIMARRRPGDKPLYDSMMAQCTDAYMYHRTSIS